MDIQGTDTSRTTHPSLLCDTKDDHPPVYGVRMGVGMNPPVYGVRMGVGMRVMIIGAMK